VPRTRIVVLTTLAGLAIGTIGLFAQSPFSHGVIQTSCAPWDGPAIQLTLTPEPAQCKRAGGPSIEIGVWRGLPIQPNQTVKFAPGSDAGFASRCAKAGDCERAESGTIVFDTIQAGSGATGSYELHFKGSKNLSGRFEVKWCETRTVCR
jgi:hypothetical protein